MGVKTFKREVAVVAMVVFYVFCWRASSGSQLALEVVRLLVVPTFLALGGAFGMDAMTRQWRV
jgi:hypothetical protein